MMEGEFLEKIKIIQKSGPEAENKLKYEPEGKIFAAMECDHSLQGSLMKKPAVIDDQNNRTQQVKHSSRKYQRDDHTEQIHARWSDDDIKNLKKTRATQAEVFTDNTDKMMCNLLLHQSAPGVEINTFKGDPLKYYYFMPVFTDTVGKKISDDTHDRLVISLSLQKKQRKPSNTAFSSHKKGDMQELKYC